MISVADYSHALATDSLKNHLQQLDRQRFFTTEQSPRHRLEWLKEVVGCEYAIMNIAVPEQTYLYKYGIFIYPCQQRLRLSPICPHDIVTSYLNDQRKPRTALCRTVSLLYCC